MFEEAKKKVAEAPQHRRELQAAIEQELNVSDHVVIEYERIHQAFAYRPAHSFELTGAHINACGQWARSLGLNAIQEPETDPQKPSIRFWRRK